MTYVTTDDVYGTAGITSTQISVVNVTNAIKGAEGVVDRLTGTTYWSLEGTGTATSGGNTTLADTSKSWATDDHVGEYVWIYSGLGNGQIREIVSHTGDTLTVSTWTTNPDNTSLYRIMYTNRNAHIENELRDGDDTSIMFTEHYPIMELESVTINSVSVTPSYIYKYKDMGKLVLSSDAEASLWTSAKAQLNDITYWYGVYPIEWEVKRLVMVYASIFILQTQMGGTHNIPSTYSLPEGSLTIGQAYINIKGTWDTLMREKTALEQTIVKYIHFG